MRKLTEPEHAATLGSYGEYGWDGWLGPYMSVAPGKDLIILVMEQLTAPGLPPIRGESAISCIPRSDIGKMGESL